MGVFVRVGATSQQDEGFVLKGQYWLLRPKDVKRALVRFKRVNRRTMDDGQWESDVAHLQQGSGWWS